MQEQTIAPYRSDAAWLVGAASYLTDRIVPDCERICLPAKEVSGGVLTFGRAPLPAPPRPRGRLSGLRARAWRQEAVALPHGDVFDLRRNDPQNWAHFLNNHLPIVFTICDRMGLSPAGVLLVLPENTPGYVRGGAEMFGLQVLTTDATLQGDGIVYDVDPWTGVRAARADWAATDFARETLTRLDAGTPEGSGAADLPRRVFLSRRKTRALLNEEEVVNWLGARGVVTIYPEDLSPADQMRLFRRAELMVAIHGAALAPLLYCQGAAGPKHLVEILHAGHMTDVYRVMAQQVGCDWIGVRGRLKPEYIAPAYDFDGPFTTYSLDNFEADIAALELAFDMAGLGAGTGDGIT